MSGIYAVSLMYQSILLSGLVLSFGEIKRFTQVGSEIGPRIGALLFILTAFS